MIVQPIDLTNYSIALANSGITQANINMIEKQVLVVIFGKEGAKRLVSYLKDNMKIETIKESGTDNYAFTGQIKATETRRAYGDLTELIEGDGLLFEGLRALLSVLLCTNFLSQNRIQVARQNVTKQPVNSRSVDRRETSEVVQSLAYTAHSTTLAMIDYLQQEGKNPLNLNIEHIIRATAYNVNASGKIPANYFNTFGWF